jgi:hypothetical protein
LECTKIDEIYGKEEIEEESIMRKWREGKRRGGEEERDGAYRK